MAIFVLGDIHGKFKQMRRLLKKVEFDKQRDYLWCTGDLVNRGKQSLEVLQFSYSLGDRFVSVFGNHDLFLLALYYGLETEKKVSKDLRRILGHADVQTLIAWLEKRPFLHVDENQKSVLVHAGLSPLWTLSQMMENLEELTPLFQTQPSQKLADFLVKDMMGNFPKLFRNDLKEVDRLRYLINCTTRMRYCDHRGALKFRYKCAPLELKTTNIVPWFEFDRHPGIDGNYRILFGHWATLVNHRINNPLIFHLDTGCAWGGRLTALCLTGCQSRGFQKNQRIQIDC